MLADGLPVTDQGIVIPKVWLGTATEVKLRHENGRLVIEPLPPKNGSGDESAIPADVRFGVSATTRSIQV